MASHAEYVAEWKRRNPEKHAAITARYEATEKARETRRRARNAWKERNADLVRERKRIGMRVLGAVSRGELLRLPCQECGQAPAQAHHPNGYATRLCLDVIWLCGAHHRKAHDR